jgi:hypothetical protein
VEVSEKGVDVHRYWMPFFQHAVPGSLRECADAIAGHLEDYCRSLIEPGAPVFSDLTGGYDSRVTSAALVRGGIPFTATVAGSERHPDVVFARRICEEERIPHIAVDPAADPETIAPEVQTSLLLSEGCADAFTLASMLRVKRCLVRNAAQVPITTVSGALGECYRDFYWSQEFFYKGDRRPASLDRLIRYRIDSIPAHMECFAADWRPLWKDNLRKYLENIIEPYTGERNTSQIDAVYLRKMAGMIGAFACAAGRMSIPLTPFGARPALDIALSVPPDWRYDARLLRNIAWALSPSLAGHMTLSGRPCAPPNLRNWYRYLPQYWLTGQKIIRKFTTVWLGRTVFPEYSEPAPAVSPYARLIYDESRPGGRLDYDSMQMAPWFAPAAFKNLLHRANTPEGFPIVGLVAKIYTCESILRTASSLASETAALTSMAPL